MGCFTHANVSDQRCAGSEENGGEPRHLRLDAGQITQFATRQKRAWPNH